MGSAYVQKKVLRKKRYRLWRETDKLYFARGVGPKFAFIFGALGVELKSGDDGSESDPIKQC